MPIYTVTDPSTGRKISLTSEDNNPPSEQELEQVFSSVSASGSGQMSESQDTGFTQATFDTSTAPVVRQKTIMQHVIEPMQDVAIEVARGLEQGTASSLKKVDAVARLVQNTAGIEITDAFANMSKSVKEASQRLPQTDIPFKGVYNFIGQAPVVMAEFAGTGGAGSMAIRAAMLGAAEEYGKEASQNSLIKGAVSGGVTMALTGGAFTLAGKGLQMAAKALEENGPSAAKAVLKLSMPKDHTVADLNKTYDALEELTSKQWRAKQGTTPEIAQQSKIDIERAVKDADETRYLETQRLNNEYSLKNLDAKKTFEEESDAYQLAKEALKTENSDLIADATARYSNATLANKQKTIDEVATMVSGLAQKAETLRTADGQQVAKGIQAISKKQPGVGVALNEVLLPKLEQTIKQIAKDNPAVFTMAKKDGKLVLTPVRKEYTELTERLSQEVSALKQEFGKRRIVPLSTLQAGKEVYQELAAKSIRMEDNLGAAAYTQLSKAFNPIQFADVATGANAALKTLGEANKKFSTQADAYALLQKAFVAPDGRSTVDTVLRALKGDTANGKALVEALRKAESVIPVKDRILGKLHDIAKRAEKSDAQYKDMLSKTKAELSKKELALTRKNTESVRRLRDSQSRLSIEEQNTLSDTIRQVTLNEKANLDVMKKTLDEKLQTSKTADSLMSLRQNDEASMLRILQNFGSYGVIGSVLSGNVAGALLPAAISAALSPRSITMTAKGLKGLSRTAPAKLNTASKTINNDIIKKLLVGGQINNQ